MDFLQELSLREWIILGCAAFSLVFNFISALVSGKKKTNILDSVKEDLVEWLPIAINIAEVNGTTGSNKKSDVILKALSFVSNKLGRKLTGDEQVYFASFVGKQIEMILSTPQKKEEVK